jgi:Domain of unknown function (DUF4340)
VRARIAVTPVALVVAAAAAAAYTYFVDRHTVSKADRAGRPRDVFPSLRPDDVDRVELEHGREVLVLERKADAGAATPGHWVLTSQRREDADTVAVDMLLHELEFATRVRQVPDGPTLAGAALAVPRTRGRIDVGPLVYRFVVGADAPRPEGAAYMSVDGEGTFVVDRSLKAQLLRGADAYRDRTIVSALPSEIARVEVRMPDGPGFALERHTGSVRVSGSMLRASRSAADRIFAALVDARADRFLDEATAREGTTTAITISVVASENRLFDLRVGGPCAGLPDEVVLIRTSPSWMGACTPKALVDALNVKQEGLVDTSALLASADEVEQIRLETVGSAGPLVDIARKGNGWHERAPEDRDLGADESASANGLALALANARPVETPVADSHERLAVRARATIVRDRGNATEVIELGAPATDGTVLARRLEDGAVLRFSREVARRFEPRPVALRPLTVWTDPIDAGSVIAVEDGCTHEPMRLELASGTWVMRAPRGFATDPFSIADLTGAISGAKAEAWVSETDEAGFGFEGRSACTVTLTLAARPKGAATKQQLAATPTDADARRVTLRFGREAEDGFYARASGNSAVFIAPTLLRDLVSHPPVDRRALRFDRDALQSVTLVRGSSRVLLDRKGDRLVRRGLDVDDAGDDSKIEQAIMGLYPQAAIHTGAALPDEQMNTPRLEVIVEAASGLEGGANVAPRETRITIGAPSQVDGADVYFARASRVDATFAVPGRAVSAILDAW